MIRASDDIRETAIRALRHIPGASRRALVNALNRAATGAKTEAVRAIAQEYPVLFATALQTLDITPARKDRLIATVHSRGPATKLDHFPHRPSAPGTGGPGKPVLRASIKRRRALSPVPGAFVIPTPGGTDIVVWRSRQGSIRRVPALSVPYMLRDEDVYQHIERRAGELLEVRLAHEIARELEAGAKR